MNDSISVWYDFTLAQIAADSYLDTIDEPEFDITNLEALRVRLRNGANYYKPSIFARNIETGNLSATQMTEVMIDDFLDTWEIIDHQENTPSGFSGTLMMFNPLLLQHGKRHNLTEIQIKI